MTINPQDIQYLLKDSIYLLDFYYLFSDTTYLNVPPASFSLFFWAGVKAAAEICLEADGTSGLTGTGRYKKITILKGHYRERQPHAQREVVFRFTSSPGCSSLSWTCCCPSTMRPGAWFLRVTMGVAGKVTWGLNTALCCWGWRTWQGFKCWICHCYHSDPYTFCFIVQFQDMDTFTVTTFDMTQNVHVELSWHLRNTVVTLPVGGPVLACWRLAVAGACWLGQGGEGQGCPGRLWWGWGWVRWRWLDLRLAVGADSAGWMLLSLEWAASKPADFSTENIQADEHVSNVLKYGSKFPVV